MADTDRTPQEDQKDFHLDVPAKNVPFFLKGSGALDWGMQNRLARIFSPESGHTVMLAIDHGYFQGPTTGLERVDVNILPLIPYCNALMLTRGILRSIVPAAFTHGVVLRASGGHSILKELSNEQLAIDMEDAARLNVSAVAVQVHVGAEFETQTIHNMTRLVDAGLRYGIPTLGVMLMTSSASSCSSSEALESTNTIPALSTLSFGYRRLAQPISANNRSPSLGGPSRRRTAELHILSLPGYVCYTTP